jgi:hypothetical protein
MINKNTKKNNDKGVALFENDPVRRVWDEKEEKWYFAMVDIVRVLTNSDNPQVYWRVLKKRLLDEGSGETVTKCNGLKMKAPDGKMRETDVADVETLLRLIQSIPSPNPYEYYPRRVERLVGERSQKSEGSQDAKSSRSYERGRIDLFRFSKTLHEKNRGGRKSGRLGGQ